jgi:Domain of unknown function (DUF4395)
VDTPLPPGRTDERRVRYERALVAIVLLAGFVWQQDLVIVAVAAVVTAGVVSWPVRPLAAPWDALVAPRLGPPRRTIADRQIRDGDIVLCVTLVVASLLVLVGLGFVGRLLALAVALLAAFEAAAGQPVAAWAMGRVRGRRAR